MSRGNTRSGPRRKAATDGTRPEYPSVREYLLSRRDVLGYLGVSVVVAGAGALFQGCGGLLPDAAGGIGDGSTTYLTMRVPIQGDLSVELADAAQCRFFVNALTYHQDTYDNFAGHQAEAEQACIDTLGQFTRDSLSTAVGILEAEVAILDDLNALSPGIAHATLTILELAN